MPCYLLLHECLFDFTFAIPRSVSPGFYSRDNCVESMIGISKCVFGMM